MALIIVTMLIIAYKPKPSELDLSHEMAELSRIDTANNFVRNLNTGYIIDASEIAAFRALQALVLSIKDYGYVTNLNDSFSEIFIYGTLNGNTVNIMKGYTLNESLTKISNISLEFLKIKTIFHTDSVKAAIFQDTTTGPEHIGVTFNLSYDVNASIVYWNVSKSFSFVIPVENLYDAYYLKEWGMKIPIIFADYNINYTNSTESLYRFINNTEFIPEPYAPSFLMRLQGNYNASECCGIESAINPNKLGFTKEYDMTYIDFCNASDRCVPDSGSGSLYTIPGITSHSSSLKFYGFKLDARHYVKFGVS